MARPKGNRVRFVFPRAPEFPETKSTEDKTNWFPVEPAIKCFVIFVDQTFSSTATKNKAPISDKCLYFKKHKIILKSAK